MDWVTTSTILEDLRDFSNEAAWRHFVGRFRGPIARFATSLGLSDAQADEVSQDSLSVFAERYRAGRYDRQRGKLRAWLFGIAHKQVLKVRERERRQDQRMAGFQEGRDALESLPDPKTLVDFWNSQWEAFLIQECFRRVRLEYQPDSVRAFEIVVTEGRSPKEAAEEIGIPIKTVYNAKHRILKRIRELRMEIEETA